MIQNQPISIPSTQPKARGVKISIVGMPAVGKTTLTRLIRGQTITGQYNPTMGFNLGQAQIDGENLKIWDFGGQKTFLKQQLAKYVHGSDIILVVTDSTPKNVLTTKELLDYSQSIVEESNFIAIANKQDIPGHMSHQRVEDVLHIPTYPMVAIDIGNREMITGLIQSLMRKVQAEKTA